MTLAHPLALFWGLLAIPIVLLYLRRPTLPRELVATNVLWQCALAEQPVRSAWQRWRPWASLSLQLTVLLLLVLALAGPRILGTPLWPYAVGAGLTLLGAEWCFYQRRWLE